MQHAAVSRPIRAGTDPVSQALFLPHLGKQSATHAAGQNTDHHLLYGEIIIRHRRTGEADSHLLLLDVLVVMATRGIERNGEDRSIRAVTVGLRCQRRKRVFEKGGDLAQQKAEELSIPKAYGDYHDLLADAEVQVVHNCTPNHMHFQVNKDIWSRISEDPSISYAWRIYTASTFGAIRVEDEHLVRVHLSETI